MLKFSVFLSDPTYDTSFFIEKLPSLNVPYAKIFYFTVLALRQMKRTIYFIRHAKSSWKDLSLGDHERPLNKRGLRDAPFMAAMLRAKEGIPDKLISSSANRALTTAEFFARAFGIPENEIEVERQLYLTDAGTLFQRISTLDDALEKVCFFGHNPTQTDIANTFSDAYIPNVPTCGILKVEFTLDSWSNFSKDKGRLVDFHFPKQYFD